MSGPRLFYAPNEHVVGIQNGFRHCLERLERKGVVVTSVFSLLAEVVQEEDDGDSG